jgi:1-aminocyclopropane-1-carboxylate deaminase
LKNLKSIGVIRGEEPNKFSATLIEARNYGMQLYFISREDYQEKKIPADIAQQPYFFIPEGGYGVEGAKGAAEILDHCNKNLYTHICCAAGTGTMAAGLINSKESDQQVIVLSVLKNNTELEEKIRSLLINTKNKITVNHDYHFGGYAKQQPSLINFMNDFYKQTNIPSDFVYTGKLFYGVLDLVAKDFFNPGSRVLIIHSGGLQGNESLNKGTLIF